MKAIRKSILLLMLAAVPFLSFAQNSKIPQRNEIVRVEVGGEGSDEIIEVFDQPVDGESHYFLSVGHLGFGDEVIQVLFDPIFELFIPLGDNLDEAMETLQQMQALFKEPVGTSLETTGCLAFGFPRENREPVKVTYRKPLLSKLLEFSVEREGYIRAAHLQKSDFNSLVRGMKFYKKLHPKK